jgi:inosose dehydratase
MTSRREFVKRLSGAAFAATVPMPGLPDSAHSESSIRIGYAAITWNENDERAIDDISALGYAGIQLRANVLTSIGKDPTALRRVLADHHLKFVALSSGNVSIAPDEESRMIDEHVAHARWLKDAGGMYLQLIGERPGGRAPESADYARLGQLLSEIGRRTADLGVPVAYHPHVGSLGETPAEIARVLAAADRRYVRLLLDVAHWQQGGGDPVAAIHEYHDRLLMLHIKDVRPTRRADGSAGFQFVELGRGTVDLRGVFGALRKIEFAGWAVVELDSVPEPGRTPAQSAAMSKRYLEDVIGLEVSLPKPGR